MGSAFLQLCKFPFCLSRLCYGVMILDSLPTPAVSKLPPCGLSHLHLAHTERTVPVAAPGSALAPGRLWIWWLRRRGLVE